MRKRQVKHGSTDYAKTVSLRDEILRKPLGLSFAESDLTQEAELLHLAIWEADKPQACLILVPCDAGVMRMRQVAVAEARQGQGLGSELVRWSEEVAREAGATEMHLHARESAVRFYEKLGYDAEGASFVEVGIPHRAMRKQLSC